MFDPLRLGAETEKIVCKDSNRKYYRFRAAPFYGGIATADCVGCNLRCVFCWAWNIVTNPDKKGKLCSPEYVASRLLDIARNKGFSRLRISGNEPTICKEHLLAVLDRIPKDYDFILETNGLLIGKDRDFAMELSRYENVHVRVSLKGSSSEEFCKITGARYGFKLQLRALKNLQKEGVSFHAAVISIVRDIDGLREKLARISPALAANLEVEPLIKYPSVMARLKKAGFI